MTVMVDADLARQALDSALEDDAAKAPAQAPPPKRQPPADATPDAPWGFKADGSPRKGPPGPGRPRKDAASAPRTEEPSSEVARSAPADVSYAQQVSDALTVGWMVLAAIPYTKPQAAVLHDGMPAMVPAWDQAARQNTAVRKYVLKLSGDGSWAWIVPVAVSTMPVLMGMWQALTAGKDLRAALAAQTDQHLQDFVIEQARAAGIQIPDQMQPVSPQPAQQAA